MIGERCHTRAGAAVLTLGLGLSALAPPSGADVEAGSEAGSGVADPRGVPAPMALPAPAEPAPVARALAPREIRAEAARRAIQPLLRAEPLGPRVLAAVADLDGDVVWQQGQGAAIPASTTKILTAAAALATLGPEHTFTTSVVAGQGDRVVLVGGGDPLLARVPTGSVTNPDEGFEATYPVRADVTTLAARTAEALAAEGRRQVRVVYDDTLFPGPRTSPTWKPSYVSDGVVAPVSALWADAGRPDEGDLPAADPARDAAATFAAALRTRGIEVLGRPQPRKGQAPTGAVLAEVEGAPVREIVEWLLARSDNDASEALARHIGLARTGSASFDGASRGILEALRELGVDTTGVRLYDGSGLSRDNRIPPAALVQTLALAADPARPELASLLAGMPVSGFSGSLAGRFDQAPERALGRVRAKTGTLDGVLSLAGVVTGRSGTPMLFVVMADRVAHDWLARYAVDDAVGALATCECAAAG